jgi:ABC-type oligopeptide transport system ATPase subunit
MSQWIMWEVSSLFENIGVVQDGMKMMAKPQEVVNVSDASEIKVKEGRLEFENISFHYGRTGGIIDNFNLTIVGGEKVGIVGRSGSGKSTLLNLILRFYDLESGRILIDGQDISSVLQESLRANIGVVTQDTSLLHRSIYDNIAYSSPETSKEKVFEAAAGSMSGHAATTILMSNPTRSSGTFFESQTRMASSWWTRRWSCVDSPLVSEEFVDEMRARYGEESNAFRIRVLGEFPMADDDTIIPFHLADSAIKRDIEVTPDTKPIWGLDVARFGADKTALCKRYGNVVTEISSWQGLDLMQTVGRVMAEYEGLSPSMRPSEILVDSIGVGGGVVDRLRELGAPVRGINVGEAPAMGNTYMNLRAELWFKTKGWLEDRSCKIPNDDQLLAELTSIRYAFTPSGKMKAESKDDMRKRGLKSPDLADALCLTMASDAATALSGSMSTWKQSIKRNLRGIA